MTFDVADLYRSLRGRLFLTDPKTLGLSPDSGERFWGVIVDIGVENGVVSLVVLRDGTTSLYFSNGGGMIGLGEHDEIHPKADRVLTLAEDYVLEGPEAERDTLPSEGSTRFNFLGFTGARAIDGEDEELEAPDHPLHPLFETVHDLIALAQAIDDKRRATDLK